MLADAIRRRTSNLNNLPQTIILLYYAKCGSYQDQSVNVYLRRPVIIDDRTRYHRDWLTMRETSCQGPLGGKQTAVSLTQADLSRPARLPAAGVVKKTGQPFIVW